jgi:hypothetical protein
VSFAQAVCEITERGQGYEWIAIFSFSLVYHSVEVKW